MWRFWDSEKFTFYTCLREPESKKETFECQQCGKLFSWKKSLNHHMRTHEDSSFRYLCLVFCVESMGLCIREQRTFTSYVFYYFWCYFWRVWLQSLKKVPIWPKKFLVGKKIKKCHADAKSVEKVLRKCTQKSYKHNKFDEHE